MNSEVARGLSCSQNLKSDGGNQKQKQSPSGIHYWSFGCSLTTKTVVFNWMTQDAVLFITQLCIFIIYNNARSFLQIENTTGHFSYTASIIKSSELSIGNTFQNNCISPSNTRVVQQPWHLIEFQLFNQDFLILSFIF